jgi:hypothetical protein
MRPVLAVVAAWRFVLMVFLLLRGIGAKSSTVMRVWSAALVLAIARWKHCGSRMVLDVRRGFSILCSV